MGHRGADAAAVAQGSELIRMGDGGIESGSTRRGLGEKPSPRFDPSLLRLDQKRPDPLAEGRRDVRLLVCPAESFPMPLAINSQSRRPSAPRIFGSRLGRGDNRVMSHEGGIDPLVMVGGDGEPRFLPLTHGPRYTPTGPGRAPKKGRS